MGGQGPGGAGPPVRRVLELPPPQPDRPKDPLSEELREKKGGIEGISLHGITIMLRINTCGEKRGII
ncbi:hypothetical protein E2C01_096572 [Portunus trituberculatus]|uniref:Uncharacterized protein n=1 Tax=Portunus trituberculatus TaxID=210409 RepID=A0A5B7K235_PORTR|nr:hypothetical protein [Portunus trituberculatus]